MELEVRRTTFSGESTIGELSIDGSFYCFTLEDVVRDGPKVHGKTAIPEGRFRVIMSWSPRFKRNLPLLEKVPGFEGIRIHAGNTAKDTEGCILVGHERGVNALRDSQPALRGLLLDLSEAAERKEAIWITIRNAREKAA